jgi:hypothetical protein
MREEYRRRVPDVLEKRGVEFEMSDEHEEIQADVINGQSTQIESDEAFCARMRMAIEAELESAPIGVVTTPGTKNPKYVALSARLSLLALVLAPWRGSV